MTAVAHCDLENDAQRKALTAMSTGALVLSQCLQYPSRAATRFHPGGALLADWDRFNLKESALDHDVCSNEKRGKRARGNENSDISGRSDDSQPTTPTKQNKATGPSDAEVSLLAKVCEAKALLKDAKEKASKMERDLTNRIGLLENAVASSDLRIANMKIEMDVRNKVWIVKHIFYSYRWQGKLQRPQRKQATKKFAMSRAFDCLRFCQHVTLPNWRWKSV